MTARGFVLVSQLLSAELPVGSNVTHSHTYCQVYLIHPQFRVCGLFAVMVSVLTHVRQNPVKSVAGCIDR